MIHKDHMCYLWFYTTLAFMLSKLNFVVDISQKYMKEKNSNILLIVQLNHKCKQWKNIKGNPWFMFSIILILFLNIKQKSELFLIKESSLIFN